MVEFRRNNRFKGNGGAFKGPRPNRNNDRRDSSREPRGECLTLRIEKMVQGGEGMARLEDGRVCFVAGALPGELCKVRLTFQKKDFTKGRVVDVLEASPDRVKPLCPLYGKCGGCSLQHLASEKQAEYLEKVERENFKRLAHAELPEDFVIHTGNAWGTETALVSCSVAVLIAAQSQKIAAQARRLLKVLLTAHASVSAAKKAITSSRLKNAPCSQTA